MVFLRKLLVRLVALSLMIGSAYPLWLVFSAETGFEEFVYIACGLFVLLAGFVVWQFASQDTYNKWNDTVQIITGTAGLTIDNVFEAFKYLDTVLGKPWLGEIKMLKGRCMIFGPNAGGEYIYAGSLGKNRIQLAFNNFTRFIKPPEGEEWRLDPEQTQTVPNGVDDILRHRFASAFLLPELVGRISRFRDTNKADLYPIGVGTKADIYLFYEEFKWMGQDFYLYDTQQHKQMKIVSPMPCKTFTISQVTDGAEIFKMTKRIFHIMPQYDLYERGVKIGRIKKKILLHHDQFEADTTYGKLELKKMNAMLGQNYQVTIENKPIGTIARNLNIDIENMVFNNFVITVNYPEYLPLMTAMAIMAAREKRRDQMPVLDTVDLVR